MSTGQHTPLLGPQSAGRQGSADTSCGEWSWCLLAVRGGRAYPLTDIHMYTWYHVIVRCLGTSQFSQAIARSQPVGVVLCGDFNSEPLSSLPPPRGGDVTHGQEPGGSHPRLSATFELLGRGQLSSCHPEHPDSWFQSLPRPIAGNAPPRIGTVNE